MTAIKCVFEGFDIFQRRFPSDLRIGAGPESLCELFPDLDLDSCLGNLKGLGICIGGDKPHALKLGFDHVVDRVSTGAANTNNHDLCKIFIFYQSKRHFPHLL